jgi:glutathione S-transferase
VRFRLATPTVLLDSALAMPAERVFLYSQANSPACARARIALKLVYEHFRESIVELESPGPGRTAFLHMSPLAEVPCLEIDGLVVAGSLPICEYLAETRTRRPLMPKDPELRAYVRQVATTIEARTSLLERPEVLASDPDAANELVTVFSGLDRLLEREAGSYAAGRVLTIADIFLYPAIKAGLKAGLDVAEHPATANIMRHLERLPEFSRETV